MMSVKQCEMGKTLIKGPDLCEWDGIDQSWICSMKAQIKALVKKGVLAKSSFESFD